MFDKAMGLADADDLQQLRILFPTAPNDRHRVASALRLATHDRRFFHAQRDPVMARRIEIGDRLLYRLREELKVTGATAYNNGQKISIPPEAFEDDNMRLLPHLHIIMFPDYSTAYVVFPEEGNTDNG